MSLLIPSSKMLDISLVISAEFDRRQLTVNHIALVISFSLQENLHEALIYLCALTFVEISISLDFLNILLVKDIKAVYLERIPRKRNEKGQQRRGGG
jgi:hypothetical protein